MLPSLLVGLVGRGTVRGRPVYPVVFKGSPMQSALEKHPGICRAYGGEHLFAGVCMQS